MCGPRPPPLHNTTPPGEKGIIDRQPLPVRGRGQHHRSRRVQTEGPGKHLIIEQAGRTQEGDSVGGPEA